MIPRRAKVHVQYTEQLRSVRKEKTSRPKGITKQRPRRRSDESAHSKYCKERTVPKDANPEPSHVHSYIKEKAELPFSYTPLKANEIRLLLLSAGDQTSPLEAKLVHAALAESLDFQALSYMWGDPSSPKTIVLEGTDFKVTKNLWSALWHIREYDNLNGVHKNRTIWIDAICINQKDIDERNQQVRLMSQIYSQASEVVAWLGPEADDSDLGMKVLQSLDKLIDMSYLDTPGSPCEPLYEIQLEPSKRDWSALISILNREYFTRVWIIQEISLANDVIFHCGLLSACFWGASTFADIYYQDMIFKGVNDDEFEEHDDYNLKPQRLYTPLFCWAGDQVRSSLAARFFHSSLERFGGSRNRLISLIDRFEKSRCSDPRDHVFALLGVAEDRHLSSRIVADYTRPLQEVYQDVIRYYYHDRHESLMEFSQDLQEMFRAPLEMDTGLEKENISKGPDIGKRRPWFKMSTWGGGFVSAFGPTLDKRQLISLPELPTLIKANLEDIAPVAGLPKAVQTNHPRYDRAVIEASGESLLGLDPQYIDGPHRRASMVHELQYVRPFLLNTGQIGLGPLNIQDGDLIRRITSRRSMAVVLRRDSLGFYTIVGRAVVLCVSAPTDRIWESTLGELITGPGDDFFREGVCGISLPNVVIFLDILTLQEWTRWRDN